MRTRSNDPFLPETLGVKNYVKVKQTGDRLMIQGMEYYHHGISNLLLSQEGFTQYPSLVCLVLLALRLKSRAT